MEALQLAQMMADLSDLEAAESRAAHSLVTANTTITATAAATSSTPSATVTRYTHEAAAVSSSSEQPPSRPQQHRRVASYSALSPGSSGTAAHATGTSTPFDSYLGRRLLSPPVTRSSSSHGSVPGTPRGNETDSDVDRASSLMALYELRAKLKQYNDGSSLRQARDKVAALSARQHQPSSHPSADRSGPGAMSTSPPQPPPMPRRHSQYTYPRS